MGDAGFPVRLGARTAAGHRGTARSQPPPCYSPPVILLIGAALALPLAQCPRGYTSAEMRSAADSAEARFADQDPEGFAVAEKDTFDRLSCLADPLSPTDVVRVQRVLALSGFLAQDEAKMRAAVAAMASVDILAKFPEAVIPSGHKLGKLLDEYAGASHALGVPLRTFPDGWIEVNGAYAANAPTDLACTLQRLDNQGAVVETRFWMPGQSLADWEGTADAVAAPPAGAHVRPVAKAVVKPAAKPVPALPTGAANPNSVSSQIARENATARHIALISGAGVSIAATGALYALAADAHDRALDASESPEARQPIRDQADTLTWAWIGGTVLSTGLSAAVVFTW